MATKIITHVLDDLDGTEGADTVTFAVDGVNYEIDLNDKNRERLLDSFAEWVGHARRVTVGATNGRRTGTRTQNHRPPSLAEQKGYKLQDIREWAQVNGYKVGAKGRIPNDVIADYDAAQQAPEPTPAQAKATRARRSRAKETVSA